MRYLLLSVLYILFTTSLFSQELKPRITDTTLPADTCSIENESIYTGDIDSSGYKVGDTIPAFALYTLDNKRVKIRCVLKKEKPVLLVSGSYTCPHFRRFSSDIDDIVDYYKDKLSVYLVYTLEAHPDIQRAPYATDADIEINVQRINHLQKIYYDQPKTYGERKATAQNMDRALDIDANILLDNPENDWWQHFGPAPNIAYLVDTNGVIIAKNSWFNDTAAPSMWCSIDNLLGTRSGRCKP